MYLTCIYTYVNAANLTVSKTINKNFSLTSEIYHTQIDSSDLVLNTLYSCHFTLMNWL